MSESLIGPLMHCRCLFNNNPRSIVNLSIIRIIIEFKIADMLLICFDDSMLFSHGIFFLGKPRPLLFSLSYSRTVSILRQFRFHLHKSNLLPHLFLS